MTAFKISGLCLGAFAAEAVLAYYLFANFAYELADQGQYGVREAFTEGPAGAMAKIFYVVFGVTLLAAVATPLIAVLIAGVRRWRA